MVWVFRVQVPSLFSFTVNLVGHSLSKYGYHTIFPTLFQNIRVVNATATLAVLPENDRSLLIDIIVRRNINYKFTLRRSKIRIIDPN